MPSHPYKDIANHLASKGRYGDTELLHVNRAELRGLAAAMPGGKLTINPHTGKPEAFLPFLLPLLGGLASSAFLPGAVAAMGLGTLGTTMAGAIGSGVVAAGLSAAQGDKIENVVGKGLLSGLGSYGLGSAMEGLASGTGATATEAAEAAAKEAATAGVGANLPAGVGNPTASLDNFIASGNAGASAEAGGSAYADIGGLLDSGTTGASIGAGGNLNVPDPSVFGDFGNKLSNAGTNYMNTAKDAAGNLMNPKALWGTFGENSGRTLLPMGLSIAGQGMFDQKPPPQMPVEPTYPAASTAGTGRQYAEAPSSYRPGRDPEWSYFQGGYRDGGRVRHPFFSEQSMYAAGDIADDKVKGYGHLREDAHEYLADNNLSERVRAPRTDIGAWTERVRDWNEKDMAEDKFPMFAEGGPIGQMPPSMPGGMPGGKGGGAGSQISAGGTAGIPNGTVPFPQGMGSMPPLMGPGGLSNFNRMPPPMGPGGLSNFNRMPPPMMGQMPPSMMTQSAMMGQASPGVISANGSMPPPMMGQRPPPMMGRPSMMGRFSPMRGRGDLRSFAEGGPIDGYEPSSRAISGPGNGLDDSIPAIIDGRVPASLSSGEHVIPAAVVSALGNGSTEEGSRQLEAMTDRILKKKFGTKNRTPRPLNPAKMLVA